MLMELVPISNTKLLHTLRVEGHLLACPEPHGQLMRWNGKHQRSRCLLLRFLFNEVIESKGSGVSEAELYFSEKGGS